MSSEVFFVSGVSLDRRNFGEKDILLTCFTKLGVEKFILKGAKKISSKQSGKTDLLSFFSSRCVKKKSGFIEVIETKEERAFFSPETFSRNSECLFLLLKFLKKNLQGESSSLEVFDKLVLTLEVSSRNEKMVPKLVSFFTSFLVSKSQVFSLDFFRFCSKCKRSLSKNLSKFYFVNFYKRTVICEFCHLEKYGGESFKLEKNALKMLILSERIPVEKWPQVRVKNDTVINLLSFFNELEKNIR